MKRLFLYPYTCAADSVIRQRELMEGCSLYIIGCVSADLACLQRKYPELKITDSLEEGIEKTDGVLINEEIGESMKEKAEACERLAQEKNKDIWKSSRVFRDLEEISGYELKELEVPVIAVLGQGEQCGKLDMAAILMHQIRKQGYSVLGMSGNKKAQVFGMEIIPEFFFRDSVDITRKTLNFHKYVMDLYEEYQPDIIVIEIPGGIMQATDTVYFHFGELASVITRAITIDAAVFNLYYNIVQLEQEQREKLLHMIREQCGQKYGIGVEFFCLSPQVIKPDKRGKEADYLYLDNCYMERAVKELKGENVVSLTDRRKLKEWIEQMLGRFSENIEIV